MTHELMKPGRRHSERLEIDFVISDLSGEDFEHCFQGVNLSLTGLAFKTDDVDMFLPEQHLHLWVKNLVSGEVYELSDVVIAHVQSDPEGCCLCGCHIRNMSSDQLISHSRHLGHGGTSGINPSALAIPESLEDFHFDLNLHHLTQQSSDIQEVAMLMEVAINSLRFEEAQGCQSRDDLLALLNLAKLIMHRSVDGDEASSEWQRLISNFENHYLSPRLQSLYDYLHQGIAIDEAVSMWRDYQN